MSDIDIKARKPLYIFDIDGTLANIEHRLHHIQKPQKDWQAFFAACVDDKPIWPVIRTLQRLRAGGAEIWIWSGRSDECKAETVRWLVQHGCLGNNLGNTIPWWPFGAPERFRMRKAGDHRDDVVVKGEWLSMMDPPEFDRLTGVFEDRARVVKMWRNAGVPCFQVAEGAF